MRRRIGIYSLAGALVASAIILAALRVGDEPGALSDWQALALGIVQGLTELLPISSSGHLILVPWLANWRYLETHGDFNQTFDVALHFGTLVAVVAYFRADLARLITAWLRSIGRRRVETEDERLAWVVAIATVPAAVLGAAGESVIADKLGEPWQIAILLALFGVILWIADRRPQARGLGQVRYGEAVALGFAQAIALAPGVSRSGVTISAARFLGLDRDAAARLSFLLLVPIVLGAVLLKGVTDVLFGDLPSGWGGPFLVGTLAAAGAGLVAIDVLLGYVRRHDYSPFVVYRLVVALFVVSLILSGVRDASF
jgi:undecaprenyl-diphosphatase